MKLKEIHIKGFRGIKDQTINNIENALVLIGKNNAGKSAFLTAIRTFSVIIHHRIKIYTKVLMILKLKQY